MRLDDDATSVVDSSTAVKDDAGSRALQGLNIDERSLQSRSIEDTHNINQGHIKMGHFYLERTRPQTYVGAALAHIRASQVHGNCQK